MSDQAYEDPEIDVIGAIIAAVDRGRAQHINGRAWGRVMDYAISLIEHARTEALNRTAKAAASEANITVHPREVEGDAEEWHVLGRRRKRRHLVT